MEKNGKNGKKKFLIVSKHAESNDLAWQIKKEDNNVVIFIEDKDDKDVGDGFVDKTDDWVSLVDWADVIIFDDNGFGAIADKLRKEGKHVVGGSVYTDKLESDREFGQEEMKECGMIILPHWDFDNFDDAIVFIKENPGRYVIKPNGKAQNEKELSFIGQEEDGKDVVQVLEHYKKNWSKKIKSFQVQKFASGVEVAVGTFFNGKDFVYPICVNFEHKRMFPGEIGPSTGEMGTLCYWSQSNTIFRQTLEKMRQKIADSGYVGYFDINCIANSKGIFPLEITSRFGYPTIQIQLEGITSKISDMFYEISRGNTFDLKTKRGFQIGVVIAVPPFPFHDPAAFKRYSEEASLLFKKPNTDGVHLGDVKLVEGDWRLAGQSGYVLVATGSASTVEAARQIAYKRVSNIMIPNMFYRTDIGVRWHFDSDRLQTWGYIY